MPTPETKCHHCGALMKEWEHRLTPGLVNILMKFANQVKQSHKNDVHVRQDIGLTAPEFNNFQKLRYFGLVAKLRDDDDNHVRGHWLLTRRGGSFLRGDEAVHQTVTTFRNKITKRAEEKVFIWEVRKDFSQGWFQQEFRFEIHDGVPRCPDCGQTLVNGAHPVTHCGNVG